MVGVYIYLNNYPNVKKEKKKKKMFLSVVSSLWREKKIFMTATARKHWLFFETLRKKFLNFFSLPIHAFPGIHVTREKKTN